MWEVERGRRKGVNTAFMLKESEENIKAWLQKKTH